MNKDNLENVYSVTSLNSAVRHLLESGLGTVWLTGEISNLARPASGHWYLTLKDARAQVKCAMFRGNNRKVSFNPVDGQQVLVRAKLSLYEPRGDYQLIIEFMSPEGDGLLKQRFEELKCRLAAEGLFSQQNKQPLPPVPAKVGLITSSTGAALHDMLTVLKRRNPLLKVIIYPSQVQGADATAQLIKAVQLANARNEVDLLVLGRGGGSLEDLWCFNEESLARAVFNSQLPVISAVGHEVDVTICDFVADIRAATPSVAAEMLSQNSEAWLEKLQGFTLRLNSAIRGLLAQGKSRAGAISQRLLHQHPNRKLEQQGQRLDELSLRLEYAISLRLNQYNTQQKALSSRLNQQNPAHRLKQLSLHNQALENRLKQGIKVQLGKLNQRLAASSQQLNSVSPLSTLARGYSITKTAGGKVITQSKQVKPGDEIITTVEQGEIRSVVS